MRSSSRAVNATSAALLDSRCAMRSSVLRDAAAGVGAGVVGAGSDARWSSDTRGLSVLRVGVGGAADSADRFSESVVAGPRRDALLGGGARVGIAPLPPDDGLATCRRAAISVASARCRCCCMFITGARCAGGGGASLASSGGGGACSECALSG